MVMFLIIKNIFKIHLFFYVVMVICLLTGNIRDYLVFTSIIIVHELGHISAGVFFSWKVKRVILLPFGGLTIFDNLVNTSLFEEFIVALMGPVFQVLFYFFISRFFIISDSVRYFNFVLLFFNLLPIYPLDGSKFLYVFLCFLLPFKYCFFVLIIISFVFIFFVFLFVGHFDFVVFLILFFLIFKCLSVFLNYRVIFNKFLFERYFYDFNFRRVRRVDSVSSMYLWCRHLFNVDGSYVSEKKFLSKLFDK